ncbi:ribosome maturation factor RimP [Candidatus Liberibacter americanus]|uniref:Ribosome maturation factor RimP n=1 Tax=Candidatus Liberibacter americanus str. Sao Paulo TaxID=1261131 RepID=U6B3M8_9HYPH|nr:ribosome maturation factor RimP [Candidatus Liberibacter americanus]AHA27545.1 hypothetical protein lam_171 [Candidatus Liberibacter americanus str. Sao Paulo]EMS36494.1 hypothetical protein G653_01012 [Candidatus Liberibacter americanus PW_SP]
MVGTHVFCSKYESRLFKDIGLDQSVSDIIQPVVEEMGFKIVQVSLSGKGVPVLQILVDRDDGIVTLCDCEKLSKAISPILDVENLVDGHYTLEVSSPGVDRPMVRKSDFVRWLNHVVKCEFIAPSGDREKLVGKILETSDNCFFLEISRKGSKEIELSKVEIPFDSLLAAKLVITDELLRVSLVGN